MAFGFISTYLGGILIQAIVNIFVYAPAIIVDSSQTVDKVVFDC